MTLWEQPTHSALTLKTSANYAATNRLDVRRSTLQRQPRQNRRADDTAPILIIDTKISLLT